jgi:ABC-type ATPase involved in cell division
MEVLKLVEASHSSGAAVVVSAHQSELLDIAERCLALRDGVKIYDGPIEAADLPELMT